MLRLVTYEKKIEKRVVFNLLHTGKLINLFLFGSYSVEFEEF